MIRVFFGPVGRMVLHILHEKMQVAHANFIAHRKRHKQNYKEAKAWAKLDRARNVSESLHHEVADIFKGL